MGILKYNIDYPRWMASVPGAQRLTSMTIPGTHDTCAREYGGASAICQGMTLKQQLSAGIRFIDIRCRHINDVFTIHHGRVYEHQSFDTHVRNVCVEFLKEHPSETIIMSVKREHTQENNKLSFEEVFLEYLKEYEKWWYLDDKIPTLDAVRGKIVLFRRFAATKKLGLNATPWMDNASFPIDHAAHIRVQDQYVVRGFTSTLLDEKWHAVKRYLEVAQDEPDDETLFVNFASGASEWAYPNTVAHWVNPRIKNYLKDHSSQSRRGIIAMDFPEYPSKDLLEIIVKQNLPGL